MGLVTRWQLGAVGVNRGSIEKWVRGGRLHPVFRGVYAVGHPALSRQARWLAAVLACGPGAVLSHLSAAALWGLVPAEGHLVDVSVPRSRDGLVGISVHRRRTPPEAMTHCGVPVTTPAQTVVDLARTFTPANLGRLIDEAQLLASFDASALPPRLRALVHEPASGIPRTILEARFLSITRGAGLPRPEVNEPWGRWEIDFLFREHGVAVETDGRDSHTRRAQFQRDRDKDRDLQLDGLIALRFTYADVMRRPAMVRAGCCRACASARARAWSAASRTR
jgi:hypothetical protein